MWLLHRLSSIVRWRVMRRNCTSLYFKARSMKPRMSWSAKLVKLTKARYLFKALQIKEKDKINFMFFAISLIIYLTFCRLRKIEVIKEGLCPYSQWALEESRVNLVIWAFPAMKVVLAVVLVLDWQLMLTPFPLSLKVCSCLFGGASGFDKFGECWSSIDA